MALSGKVSPGVVTENLNYYEDYINTEIRKGRSEEEVLAGLGDPRLIARTIVETDPGQNVSAEGRSAGFSGYGSSAGPNSTQGGWSTDRKDYYGQYSDGYRDRENDRRNGRHTAFWIPGWVVLLIVLIVIVLILGVVFSVVSFLLPVLIPILAVVFLVKIFRDWLN